jgi:hypothetical protein
MYVIKHLYNTLRTLTMIHSMEMKFTFGCVQELPGSHELKKGARTNLTGLGVIGAQTTLSLFKVTDEAV